MGLIQIDTRDFNSLSNPPSGDYYIGLDSSNSDRLTLMDSAGVKTVYSAGVIPTVLNDLTDTTITAPSNGDILEYNGSIWVNSAKPVYGTNLRIATTTGIATTTSTTPQDLINTTFASIEAGDYELLISYGWSHDDTGSDYEGYITFDGNLLGDIHSNGVTHKQEPQDSGGGGGGSGTDQQYLFTRSFYLPSLSSGTKDLLIQHSTSSGGAESSTWDIFAKLKRIA